MSVSKVQVSRFVGLDVHKRSVMVGAVDAQQQILLRPFRLSWGEFESWCRRDAVRDAWQKRYWAGDPIARFSTTPGQTLEHQVRSIF